MINSKILTYIGYLFLLINVTAYLISYRKKPMAFKVLFYYLVLTLIIQAYGHVLATQSSYNIFLSHYYFIGQFLILSLFFYKTLKNKLVKPIIYLVISGVLISLFAQYFITPNIYYKFNLFEILITSVPVIIYSFIFLVQRISNPEKKFNYFISGLFIYVLCSTLLFVAGNISSEIKKVIWRANNILYILFQVLIFIEWYRNFRKKD